MLIFRISFAKALKSLSERQDNGWCIGLSGNRKSQERRFNCVISKHTQLNRLSLFD